MEENKVQEPIVTKEQKINEAVQTLVSTIVDSVKQDDVPKNEDEPSITITPKVESEQPHNPYYVERVPFLVELKFDKWTPQVENFLMQCFMHDEALLPGLKIHKMYKATMHSDSLYLDKITEQLESIKSLVDNYRSEIDMVMKRIVLDAKQ